MRNGDPIPTFARLSGLPNGTYFWRVKATQIVGGATGSIDSPWSAVRTLTITGLGPAPGTPSFTAPANLSQFHALEDFDITWTAVPNAQYYLLEADDEPSFSAPQTLTLDPMQFGTKFRAGWGNEIPNVYYRVRAVSVDNVRGLPSATLNVKIVNTAPVAPAPAVQSPVGGATVSVPFMFDWTDSPNPQVSAYDLDVDTDPNFAGSFGVLLVQGVNRSDYVVAHDVPLPPGTYFWRVRALHGAVAGPWSASGSFRVVASPATPPGLDLLWILPEPGTVEGGASTQARVTLNGPAPTGGATVRIISDMAGVEVPATVTIPAGSTDATVSPITTVPVGVGIVGALRADYGTSTPMTSFGMVPLIFSMSPSTDSVAGGNAVTGTITLQRPAPAGGTDVTIVSGDTSLAQPPAHVVVPEGQTSASFSIATATVAAAMPVVFDIGTGSRFLIYDRGVSVSVTVRTVHPRMLAAVRREVAPGAVGSAWRPALDKVWEFIRSQPGLRTDGHNIFLYHHPNQPGAPIRCDFGVEVTRTFETAGEVYATETPGGEAAVAVHRGPYNRMNEAHHAISEWMAANRRESAGHSWEIYGDPTPDPADTETTVVYLLRCVS